MRFINLKTHSYVFKYLQLSFFQSLKNLINEKRSKRCFEKMIKYSPRFQPWETYGDHAGIPAVKPYGEGEME
jgi:hypothetical protein